MIDDSWSQPHAVTLIDFRGHGNLGLLTGKRLWPITVTIPARMNL